MVLGDQLSHHNPVLDGADRVLMIESRAKLGAGAGIARTSTSS